jgi:hypothetical protein
LGGGEREGLKQNMEREESRKGRRKKIKGMELLAALLTRT